MKNIHQFNCHLRSADFVRQLDKQVVEELRNFQQKNPLRTFASLATNWLLIAVSVTLVFKTSLYFLPFGLLVIGSRQRAFSNLVHDASHFNLLKSRTWNDFLINLLAAYPMFETVRIYRVSHENHHKYLGDSDRDPDLKAHASYNFDDFKNTANSLQVFYRVAASSRALVDSTIGSLYRLTNVEQLGVFVWWLICAGLLISITPKLFAVTLTLWFVARATSYHVIRLFAELLDHSALRPGSVLSYTRTIAGGAKPLAWLVHPHRDNYHLVHHLFPRIPHYNLENAHRSLLRNAAYRSAHHCDGYFIGRKTAIKSWTSLGGTL